MTPSPRRVFGSVSVSLVAAGVACSVLAVAAWFNLPHLPSRSARQSTPTPVTVSPIAGLGLLGLTPEVMAVAGVDAAGATQVVHDLADYLATNGPALAELLRQSTVASRAADRSRLSTTAGQTAATETAAAAVAASSLAQQRTAAMEAAFAAATASLSEAQRATIRRARANKTKWEVPLKYLAAERAEAQWLALRNAVNHVRQAYLAGRTPDPTALSLIASVDAEADTVLADTRATALPTVRQAFEAAVNARSPH